MALKGERAKKARQSKQAQLKQYFLNIASFRTVPPFGKGGFGGISKQ
jgi:hypothetical protein